MKMEARLWRISAALRFSPRRVLLDAAFGVSVVEPGDAEAEREIDRHRRRIDRSEQRQERRQSSDKPGHAFNPTAENAAGIASYHDDG